MKRYIKSSIKSISNMSSYEKDLLIADKDTPSEILEALAEDAIKHDCFGTMWDLMNHPNTPKDVSDKLWQILAPISRTLFNR